MSDIQDLLEAAVARGVAPGIAVAAITPSGERVAAAAGARGLDNPAPMTPDTVFWIASLTKALASVAAMQLVERGLVDLDAPVAAHLPGLAAPKVLTGFSADGTPQTRPATRPVTLRHLLTHTSGLAYDFCSADLARYSDTVGAAPAGVEPDIPLLFEPGEAWQYGIGIDWAGRLVENLTGQGLHDYVAAHITGPLGMADTAFAPGPAQAARQASVHRRDETGALSVMPFAMPPPPYFGMGGGGLYSTPLDYLTFLAAIAGGGAPLLKPETTARLGGDQAGGLPAGVLRSGRAHLSNDFEPMAGLAKRHGLAFLTNVEPVPDGRSAGSLAWAGLANCYYWADPATGAAGVLMSQVLPFADPQVLQVFEAFERAVYA